MTHVEAVGGDLTDNSVVCVEEIRDKGCPGVQANEEIRRDDRKEEFRLALWYCNVRAKMKPNGYAFRVTRFLL